MKSLQKYKSKAKQLIIITAMILFVISLFISCNLVFHPEELVIAQLKSADDYETAIKGTYAIFTEMLSYDNFYYPNLKGDDLSCYPAFYAPLYSSNLCKTINIGTATGENEGEYYSIWTDLYSVIASTNNIITQYEKQGNASTEIDKLVGEAYLIRAYCYFRLTRVYGKVALIDNTDVDYSVGLESVEEIYEFIESDLLVAGQLLPDNNNSARVPYVSPHKGVVKAILAEVYLSWAGYPLKDITKYKMAANTALEVIENTDSYGIGLLADFAALWSNTDLYNKESLFAIYFPYPTGPQFFGEEYLFKADNDSIIANKSQPLSFYSVESKFFNNYPDNYRGKITFYDTIYYFDTEISNGQIKHTIKIISIDTMPVCAAMGFHKFYYDLIPLGEYGSYKESYLGSQKIYLFRYAQTLLTFSEAMARSGQLNDKAYECVNMIRRRANHVDLYSPSVYDLQPGISAEAFADSVVQERAWELCGEPEGRWFDIVRLDKIGELKSLRDPGEGGFPRLYDKSEYFYPIPQGDINLNRNLEGE